MSRDASNISKYKFGPFFKTLLHFWFLIYVCFGLWQRDLARRREQLRRAVGEGVHGPGRQRGEM